MEGVASRTMGHHQRVASCLFEAKRFHVDVPGIGQKPYPEAWAAYIYHDPHHLLAWSYAVHPFVHMARASPNSSVDFSAVPEDGRKAACLPRLFLLNQAVISHLAIGQWPSTYRTC